MLKYWLFTLLVLLLVLPLAAQDDKPEVNIVLSSNQAQQGDTIYADVVIHNGKAIAGADIGVSTDACLHVVERQPGNYLPSTGESGGFSPYEELSDRGTRFAASVTDRSRIANGDGTFFRVALKVICDTGTPTVRVTFAQLAALANPGSGSNELLGYSLDQGNINVVNSSLTVHQGAVVSTAAPMSATLPVVATSTSSILYVVLAVGILFAVGMIVVVIIFYRRLRSN